MAAVVAQMLKRCGAAQMGDDSGAAGQPLRNLPDLTVRHCDEHEIMIGRGALPIIGTPPKYVYSPANPSQRVCERATGATRTDNGNSVEAAGG